MNYPETLGYDGRYDTLCLSEFNFLEKKNANNAIELDLFDHLSERYVMN